MQISAAKLLIVGGVPVTGATLGSGVAYSNRESIPAELIQITAQPQSVTADAGGSASLSVVAEGFGGAVPAYQWEVSSDIGQTWQAVASATASSLQLTGLVQSDSGKRYRVVITGGVAVRVVSEAAVLTVAESGLGVTWTQRVLPSSGSWTSIAYGDDKFVAPKYGSNIVATSTDGVAWTQGTMPTTAEWLDIAYGGGRFVAVAGGQPTSVVATSTNGTTWTQGSMPSAEDWNSVAYGNGMFVALALNSLGQSNAAAYSSDGVNWSVAAMPQIGGVNFGWRSVAYGNGMFVAMTSGSSVAATSTDGISWTQRALPSSIAPRSVSFGDGVFVAVGTNGALRSADGITWTQSTLPSGMQGLDVAHGGGVFVVVSGQTNPSPIATSVDGVTWAQREIPVAGLARWFGIAFGGNKFVAVSNFGAIAATSP